MKNPIGCNYETQLVVKTGNLSPKYLSNQCLSLIIFILEMFPSNASTYFINVFVMCFATYTKQILVIINTSGNPKSDGLRPRDPPIKLYRGFR